MNFGREFLRQIYFKNFSCYTIDWIYIYTFEKKWNNNVKWKNMWKIFPHTHGHTYSYKNTHKHMRKFAKLHNGIFFDAFSSFIPSTFFYYEIQTHTHTTTIQFKCKCNIFTIGANKRILEMSQWNWIVFENAKDFEALKIVSSSLSWKFFAMNSMSFKQPLFSHFRNNKKNYKGEIVSVHDYLLHRCELTKKKLISWLT